MWVKEILSGKNNQMSCKRVCGFLFCLATIVLSIFKYDFDTLCLLAGSCVSLLGAGLIETSSIKTSSHSRSNSHN